MSKETQFNEKILYRTHQHWIVLVRNTGKLILYIALPAGFFAYLLSWLSWSWAFAIFLLSSIFVAIYDHYLWHHSWLFIGNQKITLSVRNGIFSQYAMNVRYRNIRDSAVSKNSMLGYFLKYGTLFVRSSANEWDFQAHFVPKVGKVYALVNALSRYTDEERSQIHSIEELHRYHQEKEFQTHQSLPSSFSVEEGMKILKSLPWVTEVVELSHEAKAYIRAHEEIRNSWVMEVISRDCVLVFLHNEHFREAAGNLVEKNAKNEVFFPSLPFPEIRGKRVVSASPSESIHEYLLKFFPYSEKLDASVLVGWDR